MRKHFLLMLVLVLILGCALAENVEPTTDTAPITAESFNGNWVADTVYADNALHSMSEYNLVMVFRIENGKAKLAEDAGAYGSRIQDFTTSFEDGKLTLVNDTETIVLSFNEEGTMVWDEDGIVYSFSIYEETAQ